MDKLRILNHSADRRVPGLPARRAVAGAPFWSALLLLAFSSLALAQATSSYPNSPSASESNSSDTSSGSSATVSFQSQSPFLGGVPEGKATSEALPLSFKEAIDRGLRNNLGLLLQGDTNLVAQSDKWKELSHLLPNVSASVSENAAQIDLAAEGLRFPGLPPVVGPFGFFDARAYLTQSVFDWHAIQRERGAAENELAARYSYKDARDIVVLAVGNAYLVALSGAARVETEQAQVKTAQALYNKASDELKAGVIPAIDALRAQVELQSRQQQLIVSRNDYAKQKLALARAIGLPAGQPFILTDKEPYEPMTAPALEESLQRAYADRSDYQAALLKVRAAERFRRAATAEHYPSLDIAANYGDTGVTVGDSHGSFQAGATLSIPIFQGGKARVDEFQAEATLRQSRQQLADLRSRIDYEVRTALLDLNAAADQVQVARSSVDLAEQTLTQAQDRFAAGITDNLEVVQAQETVATAHENYISSLYAHNLAKVTLVRAMGYAEEGVKRYLQSK
jgi:outer membrane protein TolC